MKIQGSGFIAHLKGFGDRAKEFKKACLDRAFSFRKCTKYDEAEKYIETREDLYKVHEEPTDVSVDLRSVTDCQNSPDKNKKLPRESRLNSDESGFSSLDETEDKKELESPLEKLIKNKARRPSSAESIDSAVSDYGDDYFTENELTDESDSFNFVNIDDIDPGIDKLPSHAPIAKMDEGFAVINDMGFRIDAGSEIMAHLSESQELTEAMSRQNKEYLQETLTKMMCFYAGLSFNSENVQRFNDVRPFELEGGQIRSDFVLKLMTDEQSFGRFCNMGKLIRDVFPLLDNQSDLMKAMLGDDDFHSLRGEARRDAVYPFIIDGFWKLTREIWLKAKSPDLLTKLGKYEKVFALEAMVSLSGFSGELATLERKLLNYGIKGVISVEEFDDAKKCLDHAKKLQELAGRLYGQWNLQPAKALRAIDEHLKDDQELPFVSRQVDKIEKKFSEVIEKQPELRKKKRELDKEQLRKDPLRDYKKLLKNAVLEVKNKEREVGADGVERPTVYEKLKQECSHENLRAFYNELRKAIIRSVDENELAKIREEQLVFLDAMTLSGLEPALGRIPIDGLALINDTTFEYAWNMIEPDLPRDGSTDNARQSFRFKSIKHKIEKENQKLKSRARAEFNICTGSIGLDIAYQQATGRKIIVK